MKKLLLAIFSVIVIFSAVACQGEEKIDDEKIINETDAKKSSSDETVLKKDEITDALDKLWSKTFVADEKNTESLSVEKVKLLTKGNYMSSKSEFDEYCDRADNTVKSVLSKLPDRCVIETERESGNFAAAYKGTTFYILNSDFVTESNRESLKAYLKNRVDNIIAGKDYLSTEQDKQFEDVGTVVVHFRCLRWYYFDTATNKAEPVELFPDYTEIKQMYLDLMKSAVSEEYKNAVSESAEN